MITKTTFDWIDSGHTALIYRVKLTFLRQKPIKKDFIEVLIMYTYMKVQRVV